MGDVFLTIAARIQTPSVTEEPVNVILNTSIKTKYVVSLVLPL